MNDNSEQAQTYSAFFYGTLMHPKVLSRVISNDASHLAFAPAVLDLYVRHRVKYTSFPAIIPYEISERFLGQQLDRENQCVKGVVVTGLTLADLRRISSFEGNYYKCIRVKVRLLRGYQQVSAAMDRNFFRDGGEDGVNESSDDSPIISCLTYVWDQAINDLAPEAWCYDSFVENSLHQYL